MVRTAKSAPYLGNVGSESIERAPAALPDEVVALAAPNQNIETARLSSDDNCYWYEHVGPVETTLIPLISLRGGPICLERTS